MELLIFIVISIIIILRPTVGLVILINIYLLKSFVYSDFSNPCYTSECQIPSNILLGVILPVFSFLLILIRILYKNFIVKYRIDIFDFIALFLILTLLSYIYVSPDITASVEYFIKFLFIGIGYYFIGKLVIFNEFEFLRKKSKLLYKDIFLTFYFFGIFISITSYLILIFNHIFIIRLTLPGIHPIPFAQTIGVSFIISLSIFIFNKRFLNIKNKFFLLFNNIAIIYLFITLLLTNTRGVIISTFLSIIVLFFIIFFQKKFFPIRVFIILIILSSFTLYMVNAIGIEVIFNRFLNAATDESIEDRFQAYKESINIFANHVFGVGTNAFGFYSFLEYPHNLFLENIANYGIIGLIINCILLITIVFLFFYTLKCKDTILTINFVLFIYFFLETMFSFTLWMHKGLYFSMAMLSFELYRKSWRKKSGKSNISSSNSSRL